MTLVLGILILVCAVFLVIAVLLQSSKNHRMSGVISGGAETFFGKQKGKSMDATLSKLTAVIAIIFALLVLSLYIVNAGQQATEKNPGSIQPSQEEIEQLAGEHNHEGEVAEGTETEGTESEGTEAEDAD